MQMMLLRNLKIDLKIFKLMNCFNQFNLMENYTSIFKNNLHNMLFNK